MTDSKPARTANAALPANLTPYQLAALPTIKAVLKSQLAQPVTLPQPFVSDVSSASKAALSLAPFVSAVQSGFSLLPSRYHSAYVSVLKQVLEQAQSTFKSTGIGSMKRKRAVYAQINEIFASLAAPIVQLQHAPHETEIKAYLALASNLYQRFVQDETVRKLNSRSSKWPELDPLAYFLSADDGPYTLVPTSELPLALVAKPSKMLNCSALWVLDGHEVGGHGLHSIVNGFDSEIASVLHSAVKSAFKKGQAKLVKTSTMRAMRPVVRDLLVSDSADNVIDLKQEDLLAHLVSTSSLELAADAAGLLNFGPMFVSGLTLYFVTHNKDGLLGNSGRLLPAGRFDAHPADLFRILVLIAAIDLLELPSGKHIKQQLRDRMLAASGGTIAEEFSFWDESKTLYLTVSFDELAQLAPIVASALCESPLASLGNRSLSQVLTWTNQDDQITWRLAQTMGTSSFSTKSEADLEGRHLVSASLLALELACQRADLKRVAARIHRQCLSALKDFYLDQCLLCAVPSYAKSRRTADGLKGQSLEALVQNLRRSRLGAWEQQK